VIIVQISEWQAPLHKVKPPSLYFLVTVLLLHQHAFHQPFLW